MKKTLAALAATVLAVLPAHAAQKAPHDMVQKVDDGYVQGLSTAPVTVVEVSSYGCPHCSDFNAASTAELRRDWVDKGKVKIRFVPYMLFPTDIPALILSECGAPGDFFHRSDALFARHDLTQKSFSAMDAATRAKLQSAGERDQTLGIYHQSKLDEALPALGVTKARADACMVDERLRAGLRDRQQLAKTRYGVTGTPTILVNGRRVPPSWPLVRQAIAAQAK